MILAARLQTPSGAVLSRCGSYRYALWRSWNPAPRRAMFICLNPSTADAEKDDPTLRRCMDFARRWGYGGVCTGNLFAFRATDPADLKPAKNPVGPANNRWLRRLAAESDIVIAAWGNDGEWMQRASKISTMIDDLHYLKMNRSGQPAHPLYLRKSLVPKLMESRKPTRINAPG